MKAGGDDCFHEFQGDFEKRDGAYLKLAVGVHDGSNPLFLFNAPDIEAFDLCGDVLVFEACIDEREEPFLLRLDV